MAQTIKIRRGGIGAIGSSTPTTLKGELILATGSFSSGLGTSLFAAEADNTLKLTHGRIDSVSDGVGLASDIGSNTAFTGLLIHSASDNKLYRYSGTAFEELPIAAGSFTGILGVDSGGTGADTLTDGAVLIGNGTSAVESVTMTSGQFLIGNTSDNPVAVDASTIAGAGLTATTGPGTATLNVDSGSFPINELDNSSDLSVANGGTGVSTLTDHGVLVGSGTNPITALTVGTNGQLLIGANSADPAFQTVSGVITINASGVTDFGATGASAISGAFDSVSASIATDIATNADNIASNSGDISTNAGDISTNAGAISTNATNIANLTNATSSYLQDADLSTIVSASTAGTDGQIAIFNGGYDIDSSANLTYNGSVFVVDDNVSLGNGAHTVTIGNDAGATVNIGHASNTVTIAGNLNVTGTTTTVDSTTVQIGDNIIELNGTGAANGGLLVKDVTAPNTVSGSLLWDSTNDYWIAGPLSSEKRVAVQANATDLDENNVIMADSNGHLVSNGKFTTDGTYGIVADPKLSGLAGDSSATTDKVLYAATSGEVGAVTTTDTTSVTNALLGYDGTSLTFSSVIDGGTF